MRILLDTNILLLHLKEGILKRVPPEMELCVSVITVAEALRYPGLGDNDLKIISDLLDIMVTFDIDLLIARRAAELGRTRATKLPDLLIAATALEMHAPLITKNIHDFKGIPELIAREPI